MKLFLIRHGETNYNQQRKYCGFSDEPLNKTGKTQVKKLFCNIKNEEIDRVYASDLKRAVQSAQLIFPHRAVEQIVDFREMNFGVFEGLTHDQILVKYPRLYNRWLKNPARVNIPKGENLKILDKRVNTRLAKIISQNQGKTIALVAHGGVVAVILCRVLNVGLEKFWQMIQRNTALNVIEYSNGTQPRVIKIDAPPLNPWQLKKLDRIDRIVRIKKQKIFILGSTQVRQGKSK
ncbi:MAG: histidine phosphatase family protein [Candidatus Omnitrophota bacterium]